MSTSQEEFEALLEPVLGPAFGLAMSLTGERSDAEDLVQEAALLAFRGFHTFTPGTNFKAWFMRILTNAHFGRRRKLKRRPSEVEIEDVPDHFLFRRSEETGLVNTSEDPVQTLLERTDVAAIEDAIGDLPEEFREVAALYFNQEFTYPEIAEYLDVPVGTVRSRLHRARKVLQARLWGLAVEQGVIPAGKEEGA